MNDRYEERDEDDRKEYLEPPEPGCIFALLVVGLFVFCGDKWYMELMGVGLLLLAGLGLYGLYQEFRGWPGQHPESGNQPQEADPPSTKGHPQGNPRRPKGSEPRR